MKKDNLNMFTLRHALKYTFQNVSLKHFSISDNVHDICKIVMV